MPYPCDGDDLLSVVYLVDHPIGTDAQSPEASAAL
jgi:hypothetical protein